MKHLTVNFINNSLQTKRIIVEPISDEFLLPRGSRATAKLTAAPGAAEIFDGVIRDDMLIFTMWDGLSSVVVDNSQEAAILYAYGMPEHDQYDAARKRSLQPPDRDEAMMEHVSSSLLELHILNGDEDSKRSIIVGPSGPSCELDPMDVMKAEFHMNDPGILYIILDEQRLALEPQVLTRARVVINRDELHAIELDF